MPITLTDRELQQKVEDEFVWDPAVLPAAIGVSVVDRAVTLTGTVPTLSDRIAAVEAAKRVRGVRSLADEIIVHAASAPSRTDQDIAHAVGLALEWNARVPEAVRATVRNGVVTLEGIVNWEYQRRAAQKAVHHLHGVQRVANNIAITATPAPNDLHRRIAAALHRQASLDAASITVETRDTEVWLKGEVTSWSERERAEAAAWSAPGVTAVHDDLRLR